MSDTRPGLDDPLWDYVLETRLRPYIDIVRDWWANVADLAFDTTGIYDIDNAPPGLKTRFTRTPIRSPIKGIQAFPFVQTAYLQITGIQGGSTKMIDRVCLDNRFTIDEFTIVCKSNLPSTVQQGQFVAFVPTEILEGTKLLGKWIYVTAEELIGLVKGFVSQPLKDKALLKL